MNNFKPPSDTKQITQGSLMFSNSDVRVQLFYSHMDDQPPRQQQYQQQQPYKRDYDSNNDANSSEWDCAKVIRPDRLKLNSILTTKPKNKNHANEPLVSTLNLIDIILSLNKKIKSTATNQSIIQSTFDEIKVRRAKF
jgi:hypothetical protein